MRLLFISEFPPNASGGGPAVVRQMLKDWPVSELFWWCCLPDSTPRFGQGVGNLYCATIPARLYPQRKLTALRSALLEHIWTPWATKHLRNALRHARPDAIWVVPHNWCVAPAANALQAARRPYHVTVQDYIDVHNNPQRFGRERCGRMAVMADQLYARSTTRDATSHPMIEDLRARTGQGGAQMLHAGLEAQDFDFLARRAPRNGDAIRIGYAGTILAEDAFELLVSAVRIIQPQLPKRIELHLFGSHSYAGRSWFDSSWMSEHGNLPEPELSRKLQGCDWGFAPMALTDRDPRYNRFSFPTKFITYLAAGLPIITLGDPESSVMKLAAQYRVGLSSHDREPEILAARLQAVFAERSPWERYGPEIIRCASVEFDAERMRRKLYECFAECARQRKSS
jgi:hypothetical protein